ncbi:MAG: tRNA A-37 threonylcarbamoyl transferase component Bud32 [Methanophagales archaeon]|nr:tRNA A-37 threonylcarbamoyl transferase component Bud32 [Methanophagales archaeon]
MSEMLIRCAEAVVEIREDVVIKRRIPKKYRLSALDERLRRERTKTEAKIISEARRNGVPTPIIFDVNDYEIVMERIKGRLARDALNEELSEKIGEMMAKLHKAGIIHGDLTTSNVIIGDDNRIYLIDFGLSFYDSSTEARGVDVHVFFQCLRASHTERESELKRAFVRGYKRFFADADAVLRRAEEIERRGRFVERRGA